MNMFEDLNTKTIDTDTLDQYIADYGYSLLINNYSLENFMEILPERLHDDIMEWFKEYLWAVSYNEGIRTYDREE